MPINTAIFNPFLYPDDVVYASASGVGTATKGDWVAASGYWGFAANSGFIATPAYKTSGLGVALDQNPFYDELGVARAQSALPIATDRRAHV